MDRVEKEIEKKLKIHEAIKYTKQPRLNLDSK